MAHLLSKKGAKYLIILAVVALFLRIATPFLLKHWINQRLTDLPGYSGHVDIVELHLWRGEIGMQKLLIYKDSMAKKEPVLSVEVFTTQIHWRSLLAGTIISAAHVHSPRLNIVTRSDIDAKKEVTDLINDTEELIAMAENLLRDIPIRVDNIELADGSIYFTKLDSKPPIELHMSSIHLLVTNLTNSETVSDSLVAKAVLTGKAMDSGDFSLSLAINPLTRPIDFKLKSKLLNLKVREINSLANEYGQFDFERGTADIVTEINVERGIIRGYVKPLLHDVEILGSKDLTRDRDSLLRRIWESVVGAGEHVVENNATKRSGARIPLDGTLECSGTNVSVAVVEVLRNAYFTALLPNFESSANKNVTHQN